MIRNEGKRHETEWNETQETKRPDTARQDAKRNGRERKKQDETKRNDAKKIQMSQNILTWIPLRENKKQIESSFQFFSSCRSVFSSL